MSHHRYHTWICRKCHHWAAEHTFKSGCKCGTKCTDADLTWACTVGGNCVLVEAPRGWPGFVKFEGQDA